MYKLPPNLNYLVRIANVIRISIFRRTMSCRNKLINNATENVISALLALNITQWICSTDALVYLCCSVSEFDAIAITPTTWYDCKSRVCN